MHNLENWRKKAEYLGRILEENEIIYINWTNAGLRFSFTGTCLIADLKSIYKIEEEMDANGCPNGKSRKLWPYLAVFYDDKQEPDVVFEVGERQDKYLLFASEQSETHVITLRKLSENAAGKIICNGFLGDGCLEKAANKEKKLQIEFIGDSITCGFGNMTQERDRAFYTSEENGWMSHAAIAGRLLDAEVQMISCSGITLAEALNKETWELPGMCSIYPYTDQFMEKELGRTVYSEWNFEAQPKDVIVINLGTNDAAMIDICGDIQAGIRHFEETYYRFLETVRQKNGNVPWIICALGPLDYFLYDSIEKAARRFSEEKKDKKVRCFKYMKVRIGEGFGACAHPSLLTQERMGKEIAEYIQELINS